MTLVDWVKETTVAVRSDGIMSGIRHATKELKYGAMRRVDRNLPAPSIYDKSWDMLIVLDACRPDLLAEVANDYEYLPNEIDTTRSPASCSRLWMDRTFTPEFQDEMRDTVYVAGNPYSRDHLDPNSFAALDEVWEYGWGDDLGTVPARPITDRAIANAREHEPDRLLVHYMQPHFPSIPAPLDSAIDFENWGNGWDSVWNDLEEGRISKDVVWDSYRQNLEYVLDDVELLLSNVDADTTVITADHGNAFGEWGIYGHPPHQVSPELNRVPWVETSATDARSYTPEIVPDKESTQQDSVEQRLGDLGYK